MGLAFIGSVESASVRGAAALYMHICASCSRTKALVIIAPFL